MVTISSSSLDQINATLLSHNPFAQPAVVTTNNIWSQDFPDLASLNAHASDAVFHALEQIRAEQFPATSILITAQNGTGKSHIIGRIRHRLQTQEGARALFIYAGVEQYKLNQVDSEFQKTLAKSLGEDGSQGVRQCQELATAIANEALQIRKPGCEPVPPQDLVNRFNAGKSLEQQTSWVQSLTSTFQKAKKIRDPNVVRALLWTLSEDQVLDAINWLGGSELAQFKANELRLPTKHCSFDTVLQILALISAYNDLVVCFDELDSPTKFSDSGLHISQEIAGLLKELFGNLNRGVILTVMMPGTWQERVKQLPGGVWEKITTYSNPLELHYMNADSIDELVRFRLQAYYQSKNLTPPSPIYPFSAEQFQELGKERLTTREVLNWCRDNCKPPIIVDPTIVNPTPSVDIVEVAFEAELSASSRYDLDDNQLVAKALQFGFQFLKGKTLEQVTIEDVTSKVKKQGTDEYINFKILGLENGNPITIGVSVLQYTGGKILGAGFKRLLNPKKYGIEVTRNCLVRSKHRPINHHFKKTYLEPFTAQGGEYVDLHGDEINPLIAIQTVYEKRETDYDLTEEQIFEFIREKGGARGLGENNPLLKEILSDPSYEAPDIADEPDPTPPAEQNNSDDNADLSDVTGLLDAENA